MVMSQRTGTTFLGANPVENDAILRRIVLVREDQVFPDLKVRHALRVASWFYPNWSAALAEALLTEFDLPVDRAIKKLSRGMRSALGIVIGLAARAEVTLFDEPYAGLDAVARQLFYDRLLADYSNHPRTVLLSTHLGAAPGGVARVGGRSGGPRRRRLGREDGLFPGAVHPPGAVVPHLVDVVRGP
jgi:ABC-type multidrug transport system ATPase subunit